MERCPVAMMIKYKYRCNKNRRGKNEKKDKTKTLVGHAGACGSIKRNEL